MRRYLAIRWGAWGDMMYALPALEALRKECDYLHLETGDRGRVLFEHHPVFDRITTFDISKYKPESQEAVAKVRWDTLGEVAWDKAVNFWRCLEVSCIAEEWQEDFFLPRERRVAKFGGQNFYDTHFEAAQIPVPDPFDCGTMYFGEENLYWMDHWRKRHGDRFVVAFALAGSTPQKVPMYLKALAQEIRSAHPDTLFVLLGDKLGKKQEFSFGDKSVCVAADSWTYMQSLSMVKMADYVIGPETSLLVGAGLFGTPKSMICTSCSVSQATTHHKNDFSVQSTAACSPCHRAVYNPKWCNYRDHPLGQVPACNFMVDFKPIMEGVAFARECFVRGVRKTVERFDGPGFSSLPEMQPLLDSQGDRDEEVRQGILPEVRELCQDTVRRGDKPIKVGDDFKVSER